MPDQPLEAASDNLPWTGERWIPGLAGLAGQLEVEHLHRYAMALSLAQGKRVLDVASGEGYGTHLLAGVAEFAAGVDLSSTAVIHATRKYPRHNLAFHCARCTALPYPDQHFDLVVSFETLEHHDEHQAMVQEIRRVLRPDGVLLISSPDKFYYSDVPGYTNPFHVKELYEHEFSQLLKSCFLHVALYGQKFCSGSLVTARTPADPLRGFQYAAGNARSAVTSNTLNSPVYLIALASQAALPVLDTSFWELPPEVPAVSHADAEVPSEHVLQVPAFGHYRLGDDIDFRLGGNALLFQRGGWDISNAGGCWTVKADAVLQLRLLGLRSESTSLTLELEAHGIMEVVHQDTFMSLHVNQHCVGEGAFGEQRLHRWTFPVDEQIAQDASLTLCLHTINPAAPSSLVVSEDTRELGLSVHRLRITQQ